MTTMALTEDPSARTERQIVRRIVVVSSVLGLMCAGFILARSGLGAALTSVIGTLVGLGNLVAIATLIERLLSQHADKGRAGALLLLKTLALFAVAGFVVSRPWASGSSFIAGFTAVVFGIAAGGLWGADAPPPGDAAKKED
jgi:hypothetical protein